MNRPRQFIGILLTAMMIAACSSGTNSNGTSAGGAGGSVDDGKFHPDPNGVHISETQACELLQSTYQQRIFDLQCSSKTVRTCPGFVRVMYDPDCVEFDEGSVQGCVDWFNEIFNCELLSEEGCVATVYPGTEPAGCP